MEPRKEHDKGRARRGDLVDRIQIQGLLLENDCKAPAAARMPSFTRVNENVFRLGDTAQGKAG